MKINKNSNYFHIKFNLIILSVIIGELILFGYDPNSNNHSLPLIIFTVATILASLLFYLLNIEKEIKLEIIYPYVFLYLSGLIFLVYELAFFGYKAYPDGNALPILTLINIITLYFYLKIKICTKKKYFY